MNQFLSLCSGFMLYNLWQKKNPAQHFPFLESPWWSDLFISSSIRVTAQPHNQQPANYMFKTLMAKCRWRMMWDKPNRCAFNEKYKRNAIFWCVYTLELIKRDYSGINIKLWLKMHALFYSLRFTQQAHRCSCGILLSLLLAVTLDSEVNTIHFCARHETFIAYYTA